MSDDDDNENDDDEEGYKGIASRLFDMIASLAGSNFLDSFLTDHKDSATRAAFGHIVCLIKSDIEGSQTETMPPIIPLSV